MTSKIRCKADVVILKLPYPSGNEEDLIIWQEIMHLGLFCGSLLNLLILWRSFDLLEDLNLF
jgi:hypothetical protein